MGDWDAEEQKILEDALKSVEHSSITQYAIIASRLPRRGIRDVAARLQWMQKTQNELEQQQQQQQQQQQHAPPDGAAASSSSAGEVRAVPARPPLLLPRRASRARALSTASTVGDRERETCREERDAAASPRDDRRDRRASPPTRSGVRDASHDAARRARPVTDTDRHFRDANRRRSIESLSLSLARAARARAATRWTLRAARRPARAPTAPTALYHAFACRRCFRSGANECHVISCHVACRRCFRCDVM